MWWLLAREVQRLKGQIGREIPWDIVPDLFFYRDPEDVTKLYSCLCCYFFFKTKGRERGTS